MHRIRTISFKGIAIFLFLVTLPLQWIALLPITVLEFKPVHGALILIWLAFLIMRRKMVYLKSLIMVSGIFMLLYGFYIMSLLFSVVWAGDISTALPILIKMAVYFLSFIFIALLISVCGQDLLPKYLFWGAVYGVIVYQLIFIMVFSLEGINIYYEYFRIILNGDIIKLRYGIFERVFRYFSNFAVGGRTLDRSIALVNILVGSFFLYGFVILSTIKNYNGKKRQTHKFVSLLICTFCFVVVLLSTSRSNLIVFVLGLVVFWYMNSQKGASLKYALGGLGVVTIFVSVLLLTTDHTTAYQAIFDRFDTLLKDSRWQAYQTAIGLIQEQPYLGYGVGTAVWDGFRDLRVHNLFLGSWLEGGFISFVLSILFYVILVSSWLKFIIYIKYNPSKWVLNIDPSCIGVLPLLPLLRCQISGSSGFFSLIEWACLAIYFGALAQNRLELRRKTYVQQTTEKLDSEIQPAY